MDDFHTFWRVVPDDHLAVPTDISITYWDRQ